MFRLISRFFGSAPCPYSEDHYRNQRGKHRPTFKPRLEELGQRILPTAYYWDPTSGNNVDATVVINNITYYANWDLGTMGSHTHPTTLPGQPDSIVFDGSSGINGHGQDYNGNANCNVDVNLSNPVTLQNGYNSTITISGGITLNIWGYTDNDIPADSYNVAFAAANSVQNFAGGSNVLGDFSWGSGGKTTVASGANVAIGSRSGLSQSTASPLIISGTVDIGPSTGNSGTSTFKLTNGSADINVNANGTLNFYTPTSATTLVDNTGTAAQISNNGVTTLQTTPGGATGSVGFSVPFENHATLDASHGGIWNFQTADANNNDLFMDAGKIKMAGGVTLGCTHGYTQTGGTLEVADASKTDSVFVSAANGNSNFNGGKIIFDSATGYGILGLDKPVFNGVEIDMRINGTNNTSDLIWCTGTPTIKGNSKLVVTATNPVVKGSNITWTLIKPGKGKQIVNDFAKANITLPPNVSETAGALPNSWQCNS